MKLIALIGKSGTGKSHHAMDVARKKGAEAIIDDGLLIYSNKVIAGTSAKKEANVIASVKRALFMDDKHSQDVKTAIKENGINTLLILGTSDRMTDRIAKTLELGEISEYVKIEDFSTAEDIATAQNLRNTQGKHIIPVPTFAIKNEFSGYFFHPLRIFSRRNGEQEQVDVKTVVRPTYSYMGDYSISDNVIRQVVIYEVEKIPNVAKVGDVAVKMNGGIAQINISVILGFGVNIREVCNKIGAVTKKQIERMTAINMCSIDVLVKGIVK